MITVATLHELSPLGRRAAKIAYRFSFGEPWYVSHLPGQAGKDWAFTTDIQKALVLNLYWQRRFRADCEYVNDQAHFIDCEALV